MFNEFGSYNNALDNSKTTLTHKLNDRQYCPNETTELGRPPPSANVSIPSSSWNYPPPYLGNFYNSYYGNNSYDLTSTAAAAAAAAAVTHQYDSQKCGGIADTASQFHRNYSQHPHPTIQSTSVLQCCDPRCQLLSDHSKYPPNQPLNNKLLTQRSKRLAKNHYGIGNSNGSSIGTNNSCSIMDLPKPEAIKSAPDSSNKYAVSGAPCISYPALHNDLSNKYTHQQMDCGTSSYNGQTTATTLKSSKHVMLPETTPYIGNYYSEFGKSSYWNKKTFWNRNLSPPSYYPSYNKDRNMGQKVISSFEQTNSSAITPSASGTSRSILFDRLLEHREHSFDGYIPPNYYPYAKPNQFGKVSNSFNGQPYLNHPHLANNTRPVYNGSYQPSFSSMYNAPQYTSTTDPLLPEYYKDQQESVVPTVTLHPTLSTSSREIDFKLPEDRNKSSKILDQHPNLDVREFLSTWDDDIEDEKVPENNTVPCETQPVIVLDCTTLEGDVLAKVEEKLGENIANCSIVEQFAVNLHDTTQQSSNVKETENLSKSRSPCSSVIQENSSLSMTVSSRIDESDDPKQNHSAFTSKKCNSVESSHLNSDGNLTWYSSQSKKKEDLSYNLVEMTEHLVNTVDKLFSDTDKTKITTPEQNESIPCGETNDSQIRKNVSNENDWQNDTSFKIHNSTDHNQHHSSSSPMNIDTIQPVMNISSSSDNNQAGNYPQYHYTSSNSDINYNILKPELILKDTLPQQVLQYQQDQQLPYANSLTKKDTSYNFNLQKTNNDFQFSINYSKQQNKCNISTVQDFSLKYQNISHGNDLNNDSTYSMQLYEYFKYNGEKHDSNTFLKNIPPDYSTACRYSGSETVKNGTLSTLMDIAPTNLKQCPSINYNNGGKEENTNDDSDITSVRADLEKSLNEITHQYNFHKQRTESVADQTNPIQFDSSRLNHSQPDSLKSINKMDNQYCSNMPVLNSISNASSYNGVIQKTSFCLSRSPVPADQETSSSSDAIPTPSSTSILTVISSPSITSIPATFSMSSITPILPSSPLSTAVTTEAPIISTNEEIITGITLGDNGLLSMPSLSPPLSPLKPACKIEKKSISASTTKLILNKDDLIKTENLIPNDNKGNKVVFNTEEEHNILRNKSSTSTMNKIMQLDIETNKDPSSLLKKSVSVESTDFVSQQPLNLALSKVDRLPLDDNLMNRCYFTNLRQNDKEQFSNNKFLENASKSNCDDGYSSAETVIIEGDENRNNIPLISQLPLVAEQSPPLEQSQEDAVPSVISFKSCIIPQMQHENTNKNLNDSTQIEMHAEDLTSKASLSKDNLNTVSTITSLNDSEIKISENTIIAPNIKLLESTTLNKENENSEVDDDNHQSLGSKDNTNNFGSNLEEKNVTHIETPRNSLEHCFKEKESGNSEHFAECCDYSNICFKKSENHMDPTYNTKSKEAVFPIEEDVEQSLQTQQSPFNNTPLIQSPDKQLQMELDDQFLDIEYDHPNFKKRMIILNDLPVKKRKPELPYMELDKENETVNSLLKEIKCDEPSRSINSSTQSNNPWPNVEYSNDSNNRIHSEKKSNKPRRKKLRKKFWRKKLQKDYLPKKEDNFDRKSPSPVYSLPSPFLSKNSVQFTSVMKLARSPFNENNENNFEFKEKQPDQFNGDVNCNNNMLTKMSMPLSPMPMEDSDSSWSPQCPSPNRSFLNSDSITKVFSVAPNTPATSWSSICNDATTPESVGKKLSPIKLDNNELEPDINDCFLNIPSIAPTPNCDFIRDGTGDFDTHSLNWSDNTVEALNEFEAPACSDHYSAPTPKCSLKQEESRMSDDHKQHLKFSVGHYTESSAHHFDDTPGLNSKAPSPDCILNDDLEGTELESPCSSELEITNQQSEKQPVTFQSNTSNPSSVAPSPDCSIIDGVLFDDYSSSSADINLRFVAQMPEQNISIQEKTEDGTTIDINQNDIIEECIVTDDTNRNNIAETIKIMSLKDLALKTLAFQAKSTSTKETICRIDQSMVELCEKPQHMQIIIHSNPVTSAGVQVNDNVKQNLEIETDGDALVNNCVNNDDISLRPPIELTSYNCATPDYSFNESNAANNNQCQCSRINEGESVLCSHCLLDPSLVINKGQLDIQNCETIDTASIIILQESENISNCTEESLVDQRALCLLDHSNSLIEDSCDLSPGWNNGENFNHNVQEVIDVWDNTKIEVKVQLPWDKIFNLTETNIKGGQESTTLELGPAQIEVRGNSLWNGSCGIENQNVLPFVKVKRLVVQRAGSMDEFIRNDEQIEEIDIIGNQETVITTTFEDEPEPLMTEEEIQEQDAIVDTDTSKPEGTDLTCGIPRMVIKKTNCREYKSYLRMNANIHPIVRLYKSRSLDELAKKYLEENTSSFGSTSVKTKVKIERSLTDCDTRFWQWQEKRNDHLRQGVDESSDAESVDTVNEKLSMNDEQKRLPVLGIGEEFSEDHNVKFKKKKKKEHHKKPERHHCLLCHRSYPDKESYNMHIQSKYHRHLELTQRKTIHALYRHFTGNVCPSLRPLSIKERKRMKWKPRNANFNHFYHQKTPLQTALRKSVSTD